MLFAGRLTCIYKMYLKMSESSPNTYGQLAVRKKGEIRSLILQEVNLLAYIL